MRSLFAFAGAAALLTATATASAEPPCGADCVSSPVAVPPRAPEASVPTPTRMRSIPVFATGIVLDVIGAAGVGTGIGFLAASPDCRPYQENAGGTVSCGVTGFLFDVVGIAAMAGGAIFLAVGIPLTVIGGTSVPDVDARGRGPSIRASARGGSLEWKF